MPQSPDHNAVQVMVPRNDRQLVPVTPSRVGNLRKHLVSALREAPDPEHTASPYPSQPSGFTARVAGAACSLCRGWCCGNGGDDAFLEEDTMARVRSDRPDLKAAAVVQLYLSRVPAFAYEESCIFHGKSGCTLDRSLRADLCSKYFCKGLAGYLSSRAPEGPTIVISGKGADAHRSAVLKP